VVLTPLPTSGMGGGTYKYRCTKQLEIKPMLIYLIIDNIWTERPTSAYAGLNGAL